MSPATNSWIINPPISRHVIWYYPLNGGTLKGTVDEGIYKLMRRQPTDRPIVEENKDHQWSRGQRLIRLGSSREAQLTKRYPIVGTDLTQENLQLISHAGVLIVALDCSCPFAVFQHVPIWSIILLTCTHRHQLVFFPPNILF
jgi:hypothetical protein